MALPLFALGYQPRSLMEEIQPPQPPYSWLPERITLSMTDFEAGALTSILMALTRGSLAPKLFDLAEYRPDASGEPRTTTVGLELLRRLTAEIQRVRS
jgi:hypothetical protein